MHKVSISLPADQLADTIHKHRSLALADNLAVVAAAAAAVDDIAFVVDDIVAVDGGRD